MKLGYVRLQVSHKKVLTNISIVKIHKGIVLHLWYPLYAFMGLGKRR